MAAAAAARGTPATTEGGVPLVCGLLWYAPPCDEEGVSACAVRDGPGPEVGTGGRCTAMMGGAMVGDTYKCPPPFGEGYSDTEPTCPGALLALVLDTGGEKNCPWLYEVAEDWCGSCTTCRGCGGLLGCRGCCCCCCCCCWWLGCGAASSEPAKADACEAATTESDTLRRRVLPDPPLDDSGTAEGGTDFTCRGLIEGAAPIGLAWNARRGESFSGTAGGGVAGGVLYNGTAVVGTAASPVAPARRPGWRGS